MKIIAGLGNPTAQYEGTRHNIGFAVVDRLAEEYNISMDMKKHKAICGKGVIEGEKVILVKPQTFMNLSGEAIREVLDYYKADIQDVLVIYDDICLDVGRLRIRTKGSAGGHNGVKNIIAHLGTEGFARIRVGVGDKPRQTELVDYVLGRFTGEEKQAIREGIDRAVKATAVVLTEGIESAMNKYN